MSCANCGFENLQGAKFCMECGALLSSGCPKCGLVNLPNAKFCMECGTQLGSGAAVGHAVGGRPNTSVVGQSDGEPVAERRLVSVMFADLVGFTPFAEERDAEDVRDTLSRYFDLAREVVDRYGGTIEKFIGDAVMAVWGAPTAHEDDAERAVRAALDLVASVSSLGPTVQARAAVLTGEAAVTLGATNQGMVAGDLVNTASRLQGVASPGSVLVGEATQRATESSIAYEPAGEHMLKGKEAPVTAWKALRVVAERGGRNRAETLEAPFVGRHEEMRTLKDVLHATGRERRLRVVSVIGPAGIGKSRLAWEFLKYIDGVVETIYWHSGRSPAYGEGITFWALGEMVRGRCGLAERDDEQTTRAKVTETVEQYVADSDERVWIGGALLTLLGVESTAAADELFGAWRTFFERIAEQGTVLLVFEDMHFADAGLLDFIDHLLDWSRGLPIYVVTLARPDLIERRQDWGAGKRNFVSMYLDPLPEPEMRELLAGLVPGLPEAAAATIVARADGIPLYAVETIRTLIAEGQLVREGDVLVPRGDLTTLTVPDTLTALIASRLDSLDETDRRLVHDAAVLGQSFSLSALSAVAAMPEDELEPRLAALGRRELIHREMDPRSPERGQYEFVQALIREVAYKTLAKKDRKKLHLAAARYFEALDNDEIAGALASHYLAARANAQEGAEADALAGQARLALKAAATRASALGSFDQAISFLEQAVTVAQDPADQVDLLLQAATDSRTAGRLEPAEERARRALAIAETAGDRGRTAAAINVLGNVMVYEFKVDEARVILERGLEEFADSDEAVLAEMRLGIARCQFYDNDFRQALETLEGVLEVAERRQLIRILCTALIHRGNALWSLNRRREAFGAAGVARDLATEHGLNDIALRVMGNFANAQTETDCAASLVSWREAMDMARRLGLRASLVNGVANFGYTAFLAGAWDAGLAEMDKFLVEDLADRDRLIMLNNASIIRVNRGESIDAALAEMHRLGAVMSGKWQLFVADPEANAAVVRGDYKEARKVFYSVVANDPGGVEYLYRAARAALWDGDPDGVKGLVHTFEESGAYGPVAEARLATMRAGIAALEVRTKDALALYRDALAGWRQTNSTWDEAMTGLDMALLLDSSEPEVAATVESTREILERLGARPYLERLDAGTADANRPAARPRPPAKAEVAVNE
ncbi:MAG TPA: adenylate/guanylate cyclase domain-containing protein [Candidatus Limnocylindrales bacterium]|nr:adenylate/guanylate cyclase domain-containing protein [Candidatus Limnocylindrales bacterium]